MDDTPAHEVDVIVIGGGPVGENVADRVVKGGLSAALVEARLLGGECSFYACVPSKGLLRPAAAVDGARTVDGARQAVAAPLDVEAALARRTRLTGDWTDDGQAEWLAGANIDLARGHGRLAGERTVEVDRADGGTVTIRAEHAVVVATGTAPLLPPIPGLAEAAPWTNREATSADAAPRRLVVLGGGPVACELATAWRSLGSEEVTIVERGPRLLGRVEPFAAAAVEAGLTAQGVVVWTGASVTQVERPTTGGPVRVHVDGGDGTPVIEADELLVATGRTPASGDLGLETVGLEPGSWLEVDDTGRVERRRRRVALRHGRHHPRGAAHPRRQVPGPGLRRRHRRPRARRAGRHRRHRRGLGPVRGDRPAPGGPPGRLHPTRGGGRRADRGAGPRGGHGGARA